MTDPTTEEIQTTFEQMGLDPLLLRSLTALGYAQPTPIQAQAIPLLKEGRDIIGQAQTGTGKTAAFALPLLEKVDLSIAAPQLLVLAPTRELALQVCEAMKTYGRHLKGLRLLPVFGGQGMVTQLRALRRGVNVVVGTPGRLLDHLERGTLRLDALTSMVIDEADEMLRMGFIEDVEKIMEQTPKERQTALFSATMPPRIAQIAKRFLRDPAEVRIKSKETTVESVSQSYVMVTGERNKFEALNRILEAEDFDGVIVFVRTRVGTVELVEKLESRGITAFALNGDMSQPLRQRTVDRFKSGYFDILVCTDVAARGLDVPRVSHVINFHIPSDTEVYVHRIGRTGRAGRDGKAILFVARRERRMLQNIERATRKQIERMSLPTAAQVGQRRVAQFKKMLTKTIAERKLDAFRNIVTEYCVETECDMESVGAALAYLSQQERPFIIRDIQIEEADRPRGNRDSRGRGGDRGTGPREHRPEHSDRRSRSRSKGAEAEAKRTRPRDKRPKPSGKRPEVSKALYRVEVGHDHGLEPRNLVGAIANEAGLSSLLIGSIRIADDHTTVELPAGMPKQLMNELKKVWVCGVQLNLSAMKGGDGDSAHRRKPKSTRPKKSTPAKSTTKRDPKKESVVTKKPVAPEGSSEAGTEGNPKAKAAPKKPRAAKTAATAKDKKPKVAKKSKSKTAKPKTAKSKTAKSKTAKAKTAKSTQAPSPSKK